MIAYKNHLIFYGGQSTVLGMAQSFTLRDMYDYDIEIGTWSVRNQNVMERFGRRNHAAWILKRFMVVYGGMNDFGQSMDSLNIYDLEKDSWLENIRVKGKQIPPAISHAATCSVFFEQRNHQHLRGIYNLPPVPEIEKKQVIKQEGFYLFGGFLSNA